MPGDLVRWVARLMQPDPGQRFRCVADAAHALRQLSDSGTSGGQGGAWLIDDDETLALDAGGAETTLAEPLAGAPAPMAVVPAPMPVDWHRPESSTPPPPGLGLAVYRLRSLPMVGRESEREQLWSLLREARDECAVRVICLRGPAGQGKSRVARWLCERAVETGAATVIVADGDLAAALMDERLPAEGGGQRERVAWALAVLADRARERPVVLWLDDVHRFDEGLAVAEAARRRSGLGPMLLVLTAPDEALAEDPPTLARVDALPELRLGPLRAAAHMRLVRELLHLESALADEVVLRTAGNPFFAVELVGDWVDRGVLRHTERGFVLDEPLAMPHDLHAVWSARIGRLSTDHQHVLERAAVIGLEVARDLWHRACGAAIDLVEVEEHLLAAGLARTTSEGFAFGHGMLRESLERLAAEGGRIAEHHRAVASALPAGHGAWSGVRGVHRLASGDAAQAIPDLFAGLQHELKRGATGPGGRYVADLERALDAVETPRDDPLRGHLLAQSARLMRLEGNLDEALERATAALGNASGRGRALALQTIGAVKQRRGSFAEAIAAQRKVVALCAEIGDEEGRIDALISLCEGLLFGEGPESSRVVQQQALEAAVSAGLGLLEGMALYLGAQWESDPEKQARDLRRAITLLQPSRPFHVAAALNSLAGVQRKLGDPDGARRSYRDAAATFDMLGTADGAVIRLNVAHSLLEDGAFEEARSRLTAVCAEFRASGRRPLVAGTLILLAHAAAELGEWDAVLRELDGGMTLVAETGFRSPIITDAKDAIRALAITAGDHRVVRALSPESP
jgi:tetratricopeptide (TPR) repeat protein